MIEVFRVHVMQSAPVLAVFLPESSTAIDYSDGLTKAGLSSTCAFLGATNLRPVDNKQFYSVGPGAIAISASAWEACEEMYYCCEMGSELLLVETEAGSFRVINPTNLIASSKADEPYKVDRFYAPLFRIEGLSPSDIFCISGIGAQGDQFKYIYDEHNFKGLTFEKVWSGEVS